MAEQAAAPTPKVSVIIPVYNQARYLDDAIQSVFQQTFRSYEIVVVNDGSTDATEDVVRQYGERIHYVYQENTGLAGARNTGIHEAEGELIALLDSDDLWRPDFLEKMVSLADERSTVGVFYCGARCMAEDGLPLAQVVGYQEIEPAALYRTLLRSNFIIPSTVVFRRDLIIQAGMFDQTLRSCEDWDLWLRLLSTGIDFYGIPDVLTYYRIHDNSLSADVGKMQFSYRSVVEKHFGVDNQAHEEWGELKRIAFGGYYRYLVLTNIQRKNHWQDAEILRKAFCTDPMTCSDIDFYYEMALGSQPVGYRGSIFHLNLRQNAKNIEQLLGDLFSMSDDSAVLFCRRVIFGTAFKAIGLAAYNTQQFHWCRKYLWLAFKHQPGLVREKWIVGTFLKSLLGKHGFQMLHKFRSRKVSEIEA